jgi:hypothetical protein
VEVTLPTDGVAARVLFSRQPRPSAGSPSRRASAEECGDGNMLFPLSYRSIVERVGIEPTTL